MDPLLKRLLYCSKNLSYLLFVLFVLNYDLFDGLKRPEGHCSGTEHVIP